MKRPKNIPKKRRLSRFRGHCNDCGRLYSALGNSPLYCEDCGGRERSERESAARGRWSFEDLEEPGTEPKGNPRMSEEAEKCVAAIEAVLEKHGYMLAHEDGHGAFLLSKSDTGCIDGTVLEETYSA